MGGPTEDVSMAVPELIHSTEVGNPLHRGVCVCVCLEDL